MNNNDNNDNNDNIIMSLFSQVVDRTTHASPYVVSSGKLYLVKTGLEKGQKIAITTDGTTVYLSTTVDEKIAKANIRTVGKKREVSLNSAIKKTLSLDAFTGARDINLTPVGNSDGLFVVSLVEQEQEQ